MPDHIIDLSIYRWKRTRGEITVFGTWLRMNDQWRPCMVMIRTGEERHEATRPCILTMDNAWIFSDVGDEMRAVLTAIDFARCLRLNYMNRQDIMKVMILINDYLDDLISMPPRPEINTEIVADVIITNPNTGKSRDIQLTESS